jgi:hypothetical protein
MYETMYNTLVLVDTGIMSYLTGKVFLDQLWENFGEMFLRFNAYALELDESRKENK